MSRFNKLIPTLRKGAISPKFFGRKDMEDYNSSAEKLNNFIPALESGFYQRNGSRYIADVTALAVSGVGPACIPFVVSEDESYMIVINPDGTDGSSTAWLNIYKNNYGTSTISTWDYTVEAPLAALDPAGFVYAVDGHTITIVHTSGAFRPMVIAKTTLDGNSFTVMDYLESQQTTDNPNFSQGHLAKRMPFRDQNITAITMDPAAVTGTGVTMLASAAYFNVGMVNTLFRINYGSATGVCRIASYVSTTEVTIDILVDFGLHTPTDDWAEGSWSLYRGYPKTVVKYQQRLVFGGNKSQPDTIWNGRVGDHFTMMQKRLLQDFGADTSTIGYFIDSGIPDDQKVYSKAGIQMLEDDPFSFTLASTEANSIAWLSSGRNLLMGTKGAEFVVGSEGEGYSILTANPDEQTTYGALGTKVVRVNNELLYITKDGKKVRSFKYNDKNGSYVSADISILGQHLRKLGNNKNSLGYKEMFKQPTQEIVWFINNLLQLIGLRHSPENKTTGWFSTEFNNANLPSSDGDKNNIWGGASIPSVSGDDDVWIVVERENDNGTKFYLEVMYGVQYDSDTNVPDYADPTEELFWGVDSHVFISNSGATITDTLTGLSHLEGIECRFIYNGEDLGTYEVDSSGEITLSAAAQLKVDTAGWGVVGIPVVATYISNDPEAGGDIGHSEGQIQRIERADIRFYQTRFAKVGSAAQQETLDFEHTDTTTLFTGIKETRPPISPAKDIKLHIINDSSLPCAVSAIVLKGNTDDN